MPYAISISSSQSGTDLLADVADADNPTTDVRLARLEPIGDLRPTTDAPIDVPWGATNVTIPTTFGNIVIDPTTSVTPITVPTSATIPEGETRTMNFRVFAHDITVNGTDPEDAPNAITVEGDPDYGEAVLSVIFESSIVILNNFVTEIASDPIITEAGDNIVLE